MRRNRILTSKAWRGISAAACVICLLPRASALAQAGPVAQAGPLSAPEFHIVALAEAGGIHAPYVAAAKVWLAEEGKREHFTVDYIDNTEVIDDAFLSHYHLILQLNYPPYAWTPTAQTAFRKYIETGKGGWVGFHHATLLGEFDGYPMWNWFSEFMGGIRWGLHRKLCHGNGRC